MKKNFLKFLQDNIKYGKVILFDGGLGTEILKKGIDISEIPLELLNVTKPEIIMDIHHEYLKAGSNVITTNTFGANRYKLSNYGYGNKVEEFCSKGIEIAKKSVKKFLNITSGADHYVAATIGPIGRLLEPLGDLSLDEAYKIYSEVMVAFDKAKPDVIILETMLDLQEARIAFLAAKDATNIPVIVSMTYESGKRTTTGTPPEVAAVIFESMGAIAIGANCSTGPNEILNVLEKTKSVVNIPIIIQANAGNPIEKDGKTIFPLLPKDFVEPITKIIKKGVLIIGGCCGTTPEHIAEINYKLRKFSDVLENSQEEKTDKISYLASRTKLVNIKNYPVMIGERINPNAQKKIAESLKQKKFCYILDEAQIQVSNGAEILDINVSIPGIDEPNVMKSLVPEVSSIVDVPLCIDSPDYLSIENGLKYFAGKALVNSVNGEKEKLDKILPIVKRYGASVIALTMDDNGIPETIDGRFKIAKKIVKECVKHGIPRKDIFIDALVLTISTSPFGAKITLETIRKIKKELGTRTVLGLSNISFGLPGRQVINSNFFAMAIEAGLDAAITNPNNELLRNSFYSSALLCGYDKDAEIYLNSFSKFEDIQREKNEEIKIDLKETIIRGLKESAISLIKDELKSKNYLQIINEIIIPALDIVGDRYQKGIYFLPQLLLSAETAKEVSKYIQEELEKKGKNINLGIEKTIIFATVKGDLHDIGKNIVISVLKNYGYRIIDLGKSIDVNAIIASAVENNAKVICLSALMTTTISEMKILIDQLEIRKLRDRFKVIIGGAVVNNDYAEQIKADAYAKDAMNAVNILRRLL